MKAKFYLPINNVKANFKTNVIPDFRTFATKEELIAETETRVEQDDILDRKIDDVAASIPDFSDLVTKEELQEVENEIPDITGLIDSTTLTQILLNYYTKTETYTKAEVQALIASIPQFRVVVVQTLPVTGERMVLYLVPKDGEAPDVYNEYIWVEDEDEFELLGSTAVDLDGYATETFVTSQGYITGINATDVTTALGYIPYNGLINPNGYITSSALNGYATENWVGQQGYITGITSSDVTTALGYTPYNSTNPNGYITSAAITNMQVTTNLVTSVSSSSTDSQYPSAKLFYDTCGDIETAINTIRGV